MHTALLITDDLVDWVEIIVQYALICWMLYLAYKGYKIDKQTGAELPFDPWRVFRPWRYLEMTGRTLATVTGVRLIVPSQALAAMAALGATGSSGTVGRLWTVEVSFRYLAGDSERDGRFRIVLPIDSSEYDRTELSKIHGENLLVRFDPKRPEDCEPVEHKWHDCKVWTEGA